VCHGFAILAALSISNELSHWLASTPSNARLAEVAEKTSVTLTVKLGMLIRTKVATA
jgi:hypothetical protein